MANADETEIVVNLSATFWDLAPKAKVYINDQLIFDSIVDKETKIKWQSVLEDGEHSLTIELYDKNYGIQTIVENDKIIKDQLLNIDTICFDDIDIGYLKHSLSNYYPNESNEVIKNCANLGVNGKWELKFTCPIYIWLLENM